MEPQAGGRVRTVIGSALEKLKENDGMNPDTKHVGARSGTGLIFPLKTGLSQHLKKCILGLSFERTFLKK